MWRNMKKGVCAFLALVMLLSLVNPEAWASEGAYELEAPGITIDTQSSTTVGGVSISGVSTLQVGQTHQFSAAVSPPGAGTVTWSSSRETVGTVTSDGLVSALRAGVTTITASAGGYSASITLTVNSPSPPEVQSISLSTAGAFTFPAITEGYPPPAAHRVTVSSMGALETECLYLTLMGPDADAFSLSRETMPSIEPGRTDSFTVAPNHGLEPGTYAAVVEVSNANVAAQRFTVHFTVYPPPPPPLPPLPFTDVSPGDWFYPYVHYVYSNSIMIGTTRATFDPHRNVSRAMVVATLYRMVHGGTAQEFPYRNNRPIFNDVASFIWSSHYISWAFDNRIVFGFGDGSFRPGQYVTREQFATILHRFAAFRGVSSTVQQGPQWNSFTDWDQVSGWAADSMRWANFHEIIPGRTATTIAPDSATPRFETAVFLARFMWTFGG